jgi:uncharacterized small protein (DUF1192 family)
VDLTQLNLMLRQLETLNERMDELREQAEVERMELPKKSRERRAADALCDSMDDAMDSIVDAIHSLEEVFEEEES